MARYFKVSVMCGFGPPFCAVLPRRKPTACRVAATGHAQDFIGEAGRSRNPLQTVRLPG